MLRTLGIAWTLTVACPLLQAAEWHVSPHGDDANSGTAEKPLRRVQTAVDRLRPGDACIVHGGVYREAVAVKASGRPDAPIRLRAAPSETATIDGTELLEVPWTRWKGNIFKAQTTVSFRQLFFDGGMMFEARWPNLTSLDDLWKAERWSVAGPGSEYGKVVDPQLAKTGLDMTGATAVLNVYHQFYTWTRPVKSHRAGSDTFEYDRDLLGVGTEDEPRVRSKQKAEKQAKKIKDENNETLKFIDDRYYLVGKLELLDAPGEWYLDPQEGALYFYAPGGADPTGHRVTVKQRDYGLTAKGQHDLQIEGLTFFACGLRLEACDRCRVEHSSVLFSTCTEREREWRTKSEERRDRDTFLEFRFPLVTGNRNVIRDNLFAFGTQTGLFVDGDDDAIENNVFHDFGWLASLGHVPLRFSTASQKPSAGRRCRICYNTIYNSGGPLLHFNGQDNVIEYNDLYRGMRAAFGGNKDVAMLYTQADLKGSRIRYNWVHDSAGGSTNNTWGNGIGIRGDGGNATRGLTVERNVIWNCGSASLMIKNVPEPKPDEANHVWHNTTFNNSTLLLGDNKVDVILAINSPDENRFSTLYNNAGNQFACRWGGKPLPVRPTFSHNFAAAALPLVDPANGDFRPLPGSALVDAGQVISNSPETFVGSAPDIGAYEWGASEYWIPGHRAAAASHPLLPDGAVGVCLNADLIWMPGCEAVSNDVYIGTSRADVESAGLSSATFRGRQGNNVCHAGPCSPDTDYYWRIDSVKGNGAIICGNVWRFHTRR